MILIKSVLLVDDNSDLLDLYEAILFRYDYQTIGKALDGFEAIKMYKQYSKKPDFLLLDYRMPEINGIETAKKLFDLNPDCVIIMMSADTSIMEEARKIGIKGFIKKPIEAGDFLKKLNQILSFKA